MHIVITGASRGVGQALADGYAARGDRVTGTSTGGGDGLLQVDVTRQRDIRAMDAALEGQPVDLLICNAGVYLDKGQSLSDGFPPDMWAHQLAVNVTGVFLTVQELLPNLRLSDRPKIAIISSQMASHTRAPGGSYIYRASKAAALNLGRNLATDLAPMGIAVGIYHPGWVQTDMGGSTAEITQDAAATGLIARFDELDPASTGCFRTWDGRDHPY
ncbi:SDR family NAD(P)-dependent oxidoreductase [Lacimonas salitolerans]|uniref:SDR family NAD(P)-dependent oxidoreductase n=1 Tax=Lacimonas salitolerans TaxID=1323750 RepID=A0ABW4EIJ1_9RHOB